MGTIKICLKRRLRNGQASIPQFWSNFGIKAPSIISYYCSVYPPSLRPLKGEG